MPEANDWNAKTIAEFRANEGRVGGHFEGAPMVLVHHRGRNSGREYVNPMMYLPDDSNHDMVYVFASKAGAPSHPDWYYNLTAAGEGTVERGTDTYRVTVRELTGDERDRVYGEQARRYPGFADYARQTAGIRTIPVLELRHFAGDYRRGSRAQCPSGSQPVPKWSPASSGLTAMSAMTSPPKSPLIWASTLINGPCHLVGTAGFEPATP
jgi:deazaflavin-dependent oxidoreductase (nitroreductase family)